MAIQFSTPFTTYLQRTTGLVQGSAASYTWVIWFRPDADIPMPDYQTIIALEGGAAFQGVYSDGTTNNYNLAVNNGGGSSNTSNAVLTAGHWYPIGYHRSGTSHQFYVSTNVVGSLTVDMSAVTFTNLFLGTDAFGQNRGTFAYFREWTAVLSQQEMRTEACSRTAVKTASLVTDTSLRTNLLDATSNHHDWTAVGTGFSFVADDPIPAGASAADPIMITLPYSTTVDVKPTNVEFLFDHWLTYTAVAPEVYIGGWFFGQLTVGQYRPSTTVFSDAGVTNYPPHFPIGPSGTQNLRFQMPVTAGSSYWFQAVANWTTMTSHTLTIDFLTAPNETVAAGSLLINDDTQDYYGCILSGTGGDNYHVLKFVPFAVTNPEKAGDYSDSGGNILVQDTTNSLLSLYNQSLTLISTTATTQDHNAGIIRRVPDGSAFYYNESNVVKRITKDGVVGASHALTGVSSLLSLAPNTDETILYAYITLAVNNPIKKWDLVGNVYIADLVAGVAGSTVNDLMVLSDGSIVAMRMASGVMSVVHYSAAGAVLQTVAIGTGNPGSLAYDYTDPLNYVLVRAQDLAFQGSSSLFRVKLSDGTKTQTDYVVYEAGIYAAAVTATPVAKFGPSESCPFFPVTATAAPVGEPVEYLIRRERSWPHLSSEQFRQFFAMLQIDLQAGNGITAGSLDAPVQGQDPLLELDWSDDGGHTWSNIHYITTGKIGAYKTRAIKRRMGYSRDRVYRIAVSDPNQWVVIAGYLQAALGVN